MPFYEFDTLTKENTGDFFRCRDSRLPSTSNNQNKVIRVNNSGTAFEAIPLRTVNGNILFGSGNLDIGLNNSLTIEYVDTSSCDIYNDNLGNYANILVIEDGLTGVIVKFQRDTEGQGYVDKLIIDNTENNRAVDIGIKPSIEDTEELVVYGETSFLVAAGYCAVFEIMLWANESTTYGVITPTVRVQKQVFSI